MCLVTGSLLLILFDRRRWGKGKKKRNKKQTRAPGSVGKLIVSAGTSERWWEGRRGEVNDPLGVFPIFGLFKVHERRLVPFF